MRSGNLPDQPLVSVVMNCFNGERYLRGALDSVYSQTYPNWEVVFWDNASTDASPEIAHSYDRKLRYFRSNETLSLGAARNLAVAQTRGEMISFLDSDDVWLPQTLQRQVETLSDGPYAASYGGYIIIDGQGNERGTYIPRHRTGHLFEALLKQWDISVPTVVVRRSFLDRTGLHFDDNVTASEEYCLLMQLAVEHPFAVIDDVIAKYRVHERALTNRSIGKWAEEREYTLNLICAKYPGIRQRYWAPFEEAYARARYYRARYLMATGDRVGARREMRKVCLVDYRYLLLYLALFTPPPVWNWIHRIRTMRSEFA